MMCSIYISCCIESPEDFLSASGVLLFEEGDTVKCYPIMIVDDEYCDPGLFFTNIELIEGDPVIIVDPDRAEVNIRDPDCG